VAANPARSIELDQIRVELANARERLQSTQSEFRRETENLKTSLNLPATTEITLDPVIELRPIEIDVDEAIRYARELTPRLRQLNISRRESEIRLEETKGRGAFRMDLEFTYGREMQDPILRELWGQPSNTYTVDVNAYIPIWDWGQRKARVEAEEINLRRSDLQMEQAEAGIISNVRNEVLNVEELEARAQAMGDNLGLAADISRQSLERYRLGGITALDLLQSMRRESDTAETFLDAYISWRESMRRLQELTFYDFEVRQPALERFGFNMSDAGGN
jgi:outer membrane protein TolC